MKTELEYNAFPYPAISFAHTNPERMATMAAYYGITAARPDKCRVLELGCANGTNLLSHAYCFPNSEFLGIDISSRQIEDANKATEKLRLRNTTFRKCDILELKSSDLGTFDFIVAHGVYTWVPTSVRKRMLELYSNCLAENGIGYVSYNTFPGARLRQMTWDGMKFFTQTYKDEPKRRSEVAVAFAQTLAEVTNPQSIQHQIFSREAAYAIERPLGNICHDDLAEFNEPVNFHAFAEDLESHGLQFLCETDPRFTYTGDLNKEAQKLIAAFGDNRIAQEQLMDIIRCRRFRSSLVCRSSLNPEIERTKNRMNGFLISTNVRSDAPMESAYDTTRMTFRGPGGIALNIDEPLFKTILKILEGHCPSRVPFTDLTAETQTKPLNFDFDDLSTVSNLVARALDELHSAGAIRLGVHEFGHLEVVPDHPRTSDFAKLQLQQGATTVCSVDGNFIEVEDLLMHSILLLADGTRTQDELIAAVCAALPAPNKETETFQSILTTTVFEYLEDFREMGMLVSEGWPNA